MKKRDFLKTSGVLALGAVVAPILGACGNEQPKDHKEEKIDEPLKEIISAFELPALGYTFNALEPHIDAKTMEIHHGKHHAGYVKKLNKALEGHALKGSELKVILKGLKDSDEDIAVRNNAGGHFNHSLFWNIIGPKGGGLPQGKLATAIDSSFGSFENFKKTFSDAATLFGSGWAWLCLDDKNQLFVTDTANQDNPLMDAVAEKVGTPILGLDVWEHAYYLKYQNRRKEYINSFFELIQWNKVGETFKTIIG